MGFCCFFFFFKQNIIVSAYRPVFPHYLILIQRQTSWEGIRHCAILCNTCLYDLPHLGGIVTYEITLTLWCGNSWVMSWGFTISYTCMLEKHKTKARKTGTETFREWIGCGTTWRNPCTFYFPCDRGICFHRPNCNYQTCFLLRGAVL